MDGGAGKIARPNQLTILGIGFYLGFGLAYLGFLTISPTRMYLIVGIMTLTIYTAAGAFTVYSIRKYQRLKNRINRRIRSK